LLRLWRSESASHVFAFSEPGTGVPSMGLPWASKLSKRAPLKERVGLLIKKRNITPFLSPISANVL